MKKIIINAAFLMFSITFLNVSIFAQGFYNFETIDVNNFNAAVGMHGDLWHGWTGTQLNSWCEFPKGSGKNVLSSGALWMGGYDANQNLRAAATTYRQLGQEYWPGPLQGNDTAITYSVSEKWAKIWKINQSDIQHFLAQSNHTIANIDTIILQWPAKGNVYARGANGALLNIPDNMAPFVDVDNDGIYNPLNGDYPAMKGDQMLWWVFNDAGPIPHNELTFSLPLGVEIKAMVYGYNSTPALKNTLFYEFDIKNKQQDLDSFTLGTFADYDIGYASDDYIGFDSARNMSYAYNAVEPDGNINIPSSYGDSIPIAAIRFLEFPGNNCNSNNYLGSFMYYTNNTGALGNPINGNDVYQYLNHTWRDATPLRAPSHDPITQAVYIDGYGGWGSEVRYVYDNSNKLYGIWNECFQFEAPNDYRTVMSLLPMKFNKGDNIKLSFALLATNRKIGNACPSYNLNELDMISDSTAYFYCHPPTTAINENFKQEEFKIFPNPTDNKLFIEMKDATKTPIKVFNTLLQQIELPIIIHNTQVEINTSNLSSGLYYIIFLSKNKTYCKSFLKK